MNKKSVRIFESLNTSSVHADLDIVTIAYNNPFLIEYQILLLKKYITDEYTLIIADNSSELKIRDLIYKICLKYNITYYSIPINHYTRNKSHGAAMHWAYKNVLKIRNKKYFGFIDHDIFPTCSYSIINHMNNGIYGRIIHSYRPDGYNYKLTQEYPYWSIWAGFLFLESDLLNKHNVYSFNFNPKYFRNKVFLDTGGGLWEPIYKKLEYPNLVADFKQVKFRDTEIEAIQSDYYELIDNWIHFINLSIWSKTNDFKSKLDFVYSYLNKLIEK